MHSPYISYFFYQTDLGFEPKQNIRTVVLYVHTGLPVFIGRHSFQLAARVNRHLLRGSARFGAALLHFAHHIGAADHMAEDYVLAVQPVGSAELD